MVRKKDEQQSVRLERTHSGRHGGEQRFLYAFSSRAERE
jgi:hypothetical protein